MTHEGTFWGVDVWCTKPVNGRFSYVPKTYCLRHYTHFMVDLSRAVCTTMLMICPFPAGTTLAAPFKVKAPIRIPVQSVPHHPV